MIRAISSKKELKKLVPIIQQANSTVANDLNLSIHNAPTNPAFITETFFFEKMKFMKHLYFGYFIEKIVGCIAINFISDLSFGIERLSVLPEYRHKGYGGMLVRFAENKIKSLGGNKISIGMIFDLKILLKWYQKHGFKLTGSKNFDHLPFTVAFMEKEI
ncbi:MAG: GNAT family N-acetyltransferase [Promethearchaeota archaeon]